MTNDVSVFPLSDAAEAEAPPVWYTVRTGRGGATLFMALLAGFAALLGRYSGERDLVIGAPIVLARTGGGHVAPAEGVARTREIT